MTQKTRGKHAATSIQRWVPLSPTDLVGRGRHAGRRVAEAALVGAVRRPRLAQLLPAGAMVLAATGAVGALALPGDEPAAPSTASASGEGPSRRPTAAVTPPAAQVVPRGTAARRATFVRPPEHRATRAPSTDATDPTDPSTDARHRLDPAQDRVESTPAPTRPTAQASSQASSQTASQPASQPGSGPSSKRASQPSAPSVTAASTPSGGLVGTVVGAVGETVDGVVGGLLGGGADR